MVYARLAGITVLVDTAVTHIMEQAKDHTSQPPIPVKVRRRRLLTPS